MGKFVVEMDTDNAAFDDDPAWEVKRILDAIVRKVARLETSGTCVDFNGNTVGSWMFTEAAR